MAQNQDLITLASNCLCKSHAFTTTVSESSFPLQGWACHCESCRLVTGALCTIEVFWPEPRANVDVTRLKAYSFSPKYDLLFCGTCSTAMFFANKQDLGQQLVVLTSTLSNNPGDIMKIKQHSFVSETKDGGASMWLRNPNSDGNEAVRYDMRAKLDNGEAADPIPFGWPSVKDLTDFATKRDCPLPIRCRCKGVNLTWHQSNYDGKADNELPWYVDPVTRKALAGFCACESCRLAGGTDVWNWTFAELGAISFPGDSTITNFPDSTSRLKALVDATDPSIGSLRYYASSPGVQRYFCSNCSACIFYACDDRQDMVDVAIGILSSPDGARAEGHLSWAYGGTIGHLEETRGGWRGQLLLRVIEESEQWRIVRNYPKNYRRVAREAA